MPYPEGSRYPPLLYESRADDPIDFPVSEIWRGFYYETEMSPRAPIIPPNTLETLSRELSRLSSIIQSLNIQVKPKVIIEPKIKQPEPQRIKRTKTI